MTTRRAPWAGPAVVDAGLALLTTVFLVSVQGRIDVEAGARAPDAIAYGTILVAGGALARRHRRPFAVLVVVVGALTVYLARDYPGGPVFLTALVPLYTLGVQWRTRDAYLAAAASSAWLIGVGSIAGTGSGLIHVVFVGWAAAAVFLGDGVRSRRDRMVALAERAAQLEASREDEARRQVAEERVRIARDLHDSVAHALTAINVQAGTAVHLMADEPGRAGAALVAIQQQSRQALEELGALVGVLREPGDAAERAPTPGLAEIAALVETARRSGCDVHLAVDADRSTVSAGVATATYRIVQEALTNVVRHAGPSATAVVTITGGPHGALAVTVVDEGAGTPTQGDATRVGRGLVGMRERVESTGGRFAAGPRADRGFEVRASWPATR